MVPLPRGSFLTDLPAPVREAMLALGTPRDYAPGTVLLREGERGAHVLVLVEGLVKVTAISPEGHLALLAIRTAGDLVGELATMDNEPRIATVTAAGPVRARSSARPSSSATSPTDSRASVSRCRIARGT